MKVAILLTPVLLLVACEKAEEKSARQVVPGPVPAGDGKRIVPKGRTVVTPGAATTTSAAPAAAVSREQIQAFATKADALAQEWEAFKQLPDEQQTEENVKVFREKYQALMAERGNVFRGMTQEQRKEHGPSVLGSISKVGAGLTTHQLTRGRRNLLPPTVRKPAGQGEAAPTAPAGGTGPVPEDGQLTPSPELGEGAPDASPPGEPGAEPSPQ